MGHSYHVKLYAICFCLWASLKSPFVVYKVRRCFQVGAQSMMVPDPNLSELFSQMSVPVLAHYREHLIIVAA